MTPASADDVPTRRERHPLRHLRQLCRCTGYENIIASVRWAAEHPLGAVEPDAEAMAQSAPAVDGEAASGTEVSA